MTDPNRPTDRRHRSPGAGSQTLPARTAPNTAHLSIHGHTGDVPPDKALSDSAAPVGAVAARS
eukprot:scaffold19515_cov114-Isochrysis_galbana.AAC.2